MHIHVNFNESRGIPLADAAIESFVQSKIDRVKGTDQEIQVDVSNELTVLCFRVYLKEGKIRKNEISFYVNMQKIRHDDNGELEYYAPELDVNVGLRLRMI